MTHKLKELYSCLKLAIAMRDAESIADLREEIRKCEDNK